MFKNIGQKIMFMRKKPKSRVFLLVHVLGSMVIVLESLCKMMNQILIKL